MTSGRTSWQWTDENTALLVELWAEGHSAAQIATHLGGITRSGVLGKVNRMGLPRRRDPSKPRIPYHVTRKPKRPVPRRRRSDGTFRLALPDAAPAFAPEPTSFTVDVWCPLPGSHPVTLDRLTGCKWPVSDPFAPAGSIDLFCNCAQVEGKPYCPEHTARSTGQGTRSEQAAVKVAATISRLETRRGEQAAERRWDRAA